jgi:predicted dehydrogenase
MIKLIQLGVGGFGHYWSKTLQTVEDVEIVALVDISPQALFTARNLLDLPESICFTSLDQALNSIKADMLLCVTPPRFHHDQIARAVAAGLHVLCEKPLADTMADCVRILQLAQSTDRIIAVSQQYRYRPGTQTLSRLIQQGAIGEIGQIKLDFYKGWYFQETDFRRTMPYPILVDMAIHHFDLIRFITGLEAETISGSAWNPPWSANAGDTSASLTLIMNNGARVAYNTSWAAQGDFADWNGNWLIDGETGSIVYRQGDIIVQQTGEQYQVSETEAISPEKSLKTDQQLLLSDFITAMETGQQPATQVADNIRSIAMVFAAVEAVQTGREVPVLTP